MPRVRFEALREAVANAQAEQREQTVFFDRFTLRAILLAQTHDRTDFTRG